MPKMGEGSSALDEFAKAAHRYERRPADLHRLQVPDFDKLIKLSPANADHPTGFADAN